MSFGAKTTRPWKLPKRYELDANSSISVDELCKLLGCRPSRLYEPLPASKFPRVNGFIQGVRLKEIPVGGGGRVEEELEEEEEVEVEVEVRKQPSIAEFFAKKPSEVSSVSTQTNIISTSLLEAKQNACKANQIVADIYNSIRKEEEEEEAFRPWYKMRIWQSKFGSAKEGICPVCSTRQITSDSFSAGHILARSRGGTFSKDNIMPICHDCNHEMGTNHLFWFAWKYYGKVLWPFNH